MMWITETKRAKKELYFAFIWFQIRIGLFNLTIYFNCLNITLKEKKRNWKSAILNVINCSQLQKCTS